MDKFKNVKIFFHQYYILFYTILNILLLRVFYFAENLNFYARVKLIVDLSISSTEGLAFWNLRLWLENLFLVLKINFDCKENTKKTKDCLGS